MKRLIKYALLLTIAGTTLTGCVKLWEVECTECIPLPKTDIPVTTDPWEPSVTDDTPVGH